MTYQRLAYDDQDTTGQMHLDCTACATHMGVLAPPIVPELFEQAPTPGVDDVRREIRKPEITVSEATALLASRLLLDID
jgi:hypothetical protein